MFTIEIILGIGFFLYAVFSESKNSTSSNNDSEYAYPDSIIAQTVAFFTASLIKTEDAERIQQQQFLHDYLLKNYGKEITNLAMRIFESSTPNDITLPELLKGIKMLGNAERLSILYHLFKVTSFNIQFIENNLVEFEKIRKLLGISIKNYKYIESKFVKEEQPNSQRNYEGYSNENIYQLLKKDLSASYRLLNAYPTDSIDIIRKKYYNLAQKYHPDKVSYLGEEQRFEAEQVFKKITEAYETIKDDQGIK